MTKTSLSSLLSRRFTFFFFLILPVSVIISLPETVQAACKIDSSSNNYGKVNVPALSLRSTPVKSHNLIQKLPQGREFIILGQNDNGWIHILDTTTCKKGWVAKHFTQRIKKPKIKKAVIAPPPVAIKECEIKNPTDITATVTSQWLNFRSTPELGRNIISRLLKNQTVMVLPKRSDGWIQVQDTKTCKKGWIAKQYVMLEKKEHIKIEVKKKAETKTPVGDKKTVLPVKCKIKNPTDTTATVTSQWLNFRSKPVLKKNIITKLLKNQKVMVLVERSNGWIQVQDTKTCKKGWIAKQYVVLEKKEHIKIEVRKKKEPTQKVLAKKLEKKKDPKKNIAEKEPEKKIVPKQKVVKKKVAKKNVIKKEEVKKKEPLQKIVEKKKSQKQETTPISPIFIETDSDEFFTALEKATAEKKVRQEKKQTVTLIDIPVSKCMKKLKKERIGYGMIKVNSLNIVTKQNVQSNVVESFPEGELLTILDTAIDWFYVVEEKSCAIGWVPRKHVTNLSIEHPLNVGKIPIEPEQLTPCLMKLKRDTPIGFGNVAYWSLLYFEPRIPKTTKIAGKLEKGQPISIMKLENDWLEVVEESRCVTGWLPYGTVADITFQRPKPIKSTHK